MSDYKGNFSSPMAYEPSYWVNKLIGLIKIHVITAAEVTAAKAPLGNLDDFTDVLPTCNVYRPSGADYIALPTNFTIGYQDVDGVSVVFLKGNANYTLTAGDTIVYMY